MSILQEATPMQWDLGTDTITAAIVASVRHCQCLADVPLATVRKTPTSCLWVRKVTPIRGGSLTFSGKHPERCSPVSLWAAALCLSNIPHFVHTSLNDNARPSPGPNLTLWFLCGCNESTKDCTMMSYSARETEASSESHLALLRVATDGTFSGSCVCYHLKTVFPFIQKSNRETRA